ncbi:phytanoyl-CoA dioxygenase family protein [Marinicella sp. W31]|uniref:phytanoyl-CoA dioxygenase family protein n=1 Tax=Marinicella sp. W31 TaxID=3023713 RepID=UPI003757AA8E
MVSAEEKLQFQEQGFLVKRQMIDQGLLEDIRQQAKHHLHNRLPPFELEAVVQYPGAPTSVQAQGGDTIRRLLLAFSRGESIRQWAKNKMVKSILSELFDDDTVMLSQSHHNCIMTKQPNYSSSTGWHKDIRYWKFSNDFLINTWLALGAETHDNGCLRIIPGSHLWMPEKDQMDDVLFLKEDRLKNDDWLDKAIEVELQAGDVLFFHAALFHAAGNNKHDQSKFSLVFTYHSSQTQPLENTKSTSYEEITI